MTATEEFDADAEVLHRIALENPFDRVKRRLLFKDPDTLEYSLETLTCGRIAFTVSILTGTGAFLISAPVAKQNYLSANVHTSYLTNWSARRMAADAYMLGGLKKGIKWMVISYCAVTAYSYLSQAIELYRLKTSVANYAASGALLGGASRVLLGPRGMIAGSILGAYFGTLSGYSIASAMRHYNGTVDQRYFHEIKTRVMKDRFYSEESSRVAAQLKIIEESENTASDTKNSVTPKKDSS